MSATGLDVFDRTLQTTHLWLNDIGAMLGVNRTRAWNVLGAVLRALRDRLPPVLSANLAAELPLLVRGAYYADYRPELQPADWRTADEFLDEVDFHLFGPILADDAAEAVFDVLSSRLPEGICDKVRSALPPDIRRLWRGEPPTEPYLEPYRGVYSSRGGRTLRGALPMT
jgi:uncharacterized protein (DUF2267 family)